MICLDRSRKKLIRVGLLLASAIGLPACGVTRPNLFSPGNLDTQRARAVMFDPYSDVDIGPEVVGGRPRQFQRPLPQADRNELVQQTQMPLFPAPR